MLTDITQVSSAKFELFAMTISNKHINYVCKNLAGISEDVFELYIMVKKNRTSVIFCITSVKMVQYE